MTSFLIIFVIFGCSVILTKALKEKKYMRFKTSYKSNSKLQYDTACGVAESMAKLYRKEAARLKLEDYAPNQTSYTIKKNDVTTEKYGGYKNAIKKYGSGIYLRHNDYEMDWLVTIALACGYSLEENYMARIYAEEIWENFLTHIDEETIAEWQNKYINCPKQNLQEYLSTALWLKEKILEGDSVCCYRAYINPKILDIVATTFGLPTNDELNKLNMTTYHNLADVIWSYANKVVNQQGFCPTSIREITPRPTAEQKNRQYTVLSEYEEKILKMNEAERIRGEYL